MLPISAIDLARATPAPYRANAWGMDIVARTVRPPIKTANFAQIPPEAIALFLPRSPLSTQFSTSYFPPLPRDWPASRQRWHRHAFRAPETLRSYWLLRRSAQYR